MENILIYTEIIISFILIFSTILQETKNAPTPNYSENKNNSKPKGKEAFFNNLTKVSGILFFLNALLLLSV